MKRTLRPFTMPHGVGFFLLAYAEKRADREHTVTCLRYLHKWPVAKINALLDQIDRGAIYLVDTYHTGVNRR